MKEPKFKIGDKVYYSESDDYGHFTVYKAEIVSINFEYNKNGSRINYIILLKSITNIQTYTYTRSDIPENALYTEEEIKEKYLEWISRLKKLGDE